METLAQEPIITTVPLDVIVTVAVTHRSPDRECPG